MASLLFYLAIIVLAIAARPYLQRPTPLEPVQPGDAVVITGTSTGIGKHAALSLAREGYKVFACVRKTADGDALMASARTHGVDTDNINILILDVTNSEQIAKGVEIVSQYVGERGLKGLFNNAGIGFDYSGDVVSTSVEFTSMDQYRKIFDVNYFGLVETTKAFLSLLREHGDGRIIMNASVAGYLATPFMSHYASSKHAVEGFSDSLRRELRPHGVMVSILECGFVTTRIINGFVPEGVEPYKQAEQRQSKIFWKRSIGAPSPRVSSEAVMHALRAKEPQLRYVVGKNSAMLKVMRYFPGEWVDAMLSMDSEKDEIGERELEELLRESKKEFDL